jgi:PPK2 family polyphosphate:nucleotide phosphotransferase
MPSAPSSLYLVPFDGSFKLEKTSTKPPTDVPDKKDLKKSLDKHVSRLDELQRIFYAHDKHSILLIFQGMDAAGKDGTIRAVLQGINPAGCQVFSFKQPSAEELDHDFLWRTARHLPERGRIGVFNRSYYEEVLIVKVHPEFLDNQKLPELDMSDRIWEDRYKSIRDHEEHLAKNGTLILKFWLNISRDEQRRRFLSRLDEPEKNWKFSSGDIKERLSWDEYMLAFESALSATSRPHAPWYAIPADSKSYMRFCVADILVKAMESLDLRYPEVAENERSRFDEMRQLLEND